MATMQGVLLGTAAYMSPEQAKAKSVDRRADIWAFGCVLYEMLTGKQAFTGETVTDTLASIIKEEPDLTKLPATTPMRVRVLLQRCLRKDPKQRLRDIGDARISLDEVLSGVPDLALAGRAEAAAVPLWGRTLPWAALAACLAIALVALAFMHFRQKPPAPADTMRFEIALPKKATMADADPFVLSPDGRQLAFSATGSDGIYRTWIRSLDSLETRPVPGSEYFQSQGYPIFFWSPDNRYIAFDSGGKLKKRNVSNGEAEDICDLSGTAIDGSWRDDVIIFAEQAAGIMRVSPAGGIASPITTIDSSRKETNHDLPSFLPDGRHFVYLRFSSLPENSGVYIGSLDAKPADQSLKRLLAADDFPVIFVPSSDARLGQLLFVRNGTLLAQTFDAGRLELAGEPIAVANLGKATKFGVFSASGYGVLVYRPITSADSQLTWFDRQGKVLGTVGEPTDYVAVALSPDGTRAAFNRGFDATDPNLSLWLLDFSKGTTTRLTFGSPHTEAPIWSPDGKRIIFASTLNGFFDLYEKLASGAEDEQLLLKSRENKFPSSVSRDGRFLLYFAIDSKTSKFGLWVLPLEGDKKPFPFLHTGFNEVDGHFSPDGHWVAYVSDESGRYEVYVRRFSGDTAVSPPGEGAKWQVSYEGGREARWSADGKELYYTTLDGKVMVVGVSTNTAFEAAPAKLLFQAPLEISRTTGDHTVDGKRFLFLTSPEQAAQTPFTVVLNWQGGLKK